MDEFKEKVRYNLNRHGAFLRALNFSESYIKESLDNTEKWATTRLLQGIDDQFIMRQTAQILENQLIFNENSKELSPRWKRISVPIHRRVWGPFMGNEWVSVQAMKKPEENVYYMSLEEKTIPTILTAKTRNLKTSWEEISTGNLEVEANAVADFSLKLFNEYSREILNDLYNNAGTKATYPFKDKEDLLSLIEGMSSYIGAKIKRDATWIVTSSKIVETLNQEIERSLEEDDEDTLRYAGKLKNWKVFEDKEFPDGRILMGHKDNRNHYMTGYIFAPLYPVAPYKDIMEFEGKKVNPCHGRYGKKLVNPDFYGVLEINFQEEEASSDTK
jgi:hypothetical protein